VRWEKLCNELDDWRKKDGREMKHLNASGAGGVSRWVGVYPHDKALSE
jgi:hypothetical protein